jgi:hypothetical protein
MTDGLSKENITNTLINILNYEDENYNLISIPVSGG